MKLTCKQQDLAKGLSIVSHAVSTRTTLPILSHILVATEGDAVRLSATNLEIGITCRVPANVKEEGTTTVPARLFTDFVNSLPPAGVDLALQPESQSLKVSGQRSQATIRGMDPSEFPSIPAAEGSETPVILDAKELREMIAQTTFAAATDDARPVFTGVLARVHGGELIFAAADSFRLAVRRTALPGEAADGDVLIPARTLGELAKILPAEGVVRMVVTPNRNQVLFEAEVDDVRLVSNLISGQFPNFEAIVPKGAATRATLDATQFRQAAKTASLFARDSANIVKLKVDAGENDGMTPGIITLQATAEEVGDATTTVDAAVDGKGLEIIFNVKYLTDVLGVIDTPEVALELNLPSQPGVVKPIGDLHDKYTYVIMPMHSTR
ncbi:MAG: DNA polymerase III beta subunit [Ktedonobacterales bacterium]|nr:MAG: DNA polymerase III beta subunit [Ktedonobacterales bacterium]